MEGTQLPGPALKDLYADMLLIRLVEETIAARYGEQEMRCPVHLSTGQEAVAVGVCRALERTDKVYSTHRSHAHYLAKGGGLAAMMAEIYGKEAGCCGGRGGSMHLFDPDAGMALSVPIVGSSIPLAAGAALAFAQRGESSVALAFVGDGAIEEGVFHETLNFASLRRLPVLFVCENNFFSIYTPIGERQPSRPPTDLAAAHDVPAVSGDGNDVASVHRATAACVARARSGGGPSFLAFDTYRWREHCGPNDDDHLGYRPRREVEAWLARDPVARARDALIACGDLDEAGAGALEAELQTRVDEAVAFARNAHLPDPSTAGLRVYA